MKVTFRRSLIFLIPTLVLISVPVFAASPVTPIPPIPPISPAPTPEAKTSLYQNLELFSSVLEIVRKNYVDEKNSQELIYGALHGLLSSLDPYSQFMEPDIYQEMKVDTKGQFGGLGIEITLRDGWLTIITPIEDTPASRAGLEPGDRIVKINGKSTKNITLMGAVKKLRGKPGTTVHITVMRRGAKKFLEFDLTRAIIPIVSIKEAKILEDGIGYIRLAQFQQNTLKEFDEATEKLQQEDLRALILDLRYDPGGLLTAAIGVADRFLPKGKVIVQTVGRGDKVEMEAKSTGRDRFKGIPVVVLINNGSASGSEIVAGALRDNNRAVLVGTKTFGKGSVQSVLPLRDKSALRLTTGHYYTASHRKIQDEGITPDIEIKMTQEETKALLQQRYKALVDLDAKLKPTPTPGDPVEEEDEIEEETETEGEKPAYDPQLQRAVDLLKGEMIFRTFQQRGEEGE